MKLYHVTALIDEEWPNTFFVATDNDAAFAAWAKKRGVSFKLVQWPLKVIRGREVDESENIDEPGNGKGI